ncbi:MAG TPA: ABC transporter permease [Thermoanaerobaculia bacterium]|nr:ABC transporter permease [Thermoanaerobaculia bacterium]
MNQPLLFRSILLRAWRFKARTLAMGLGITIAVLATVLLQTVAGNVRQAFNAFVNGAYPADCIVMVAGSGFMGAGPGRNKLKLADIQTVVSSLGIADWDPVVYIGPRDVKNEGNNFAVGVGGFSEKAESIRRRSVQEGEFLTAEDVKNRASVALLGSTTAKKLFPGGTPVGAQIFIDNMSYQVKGVLESIGVDPHGEDQDDVIFVPYTTLMEKMVKVSSISGATLVLEDPRRMEEIGREITQIMRERHQLGEGEDDDFSVLTATQMQELVGKAFRTFDIFVPLIAGTAFLISALVILTIMQISIKGRTAEIGLRKAVGARPRDLQSQIVLEVVMVSAVASLIGLVLAQAGLLAAAPTLAAKFGVKQVGSPALVPVIAVLGAMLTGIVGGIVPARRAAKLDPVKALK